LKAWMLSQLHIILSEPKVYKNVRSFHNCSVFMAYPVDSTDFGNGARG